VLAEESWRDVLMRLRTLHPKAGNLSGKGVPIDPYATDIGMIHRVLKMKTHLRGVAQLQADKHELLLAAKLSPQSNKKDPLLDTDMHSLNIYASNLKTNITTPPKPSVTVSNTQESTDQTALEKRK
jgi:hypothetical protein